MPSSIGSDGVPYLVPGDVTCAVQVTLVQPPLMRAPPSGLFHVRFSVCSDSGPDAVVSAICVAGIARRVT